MNLHEYNIIIINSSGGKDSLCAVYQICKMAEEQLYPLDNILISHQDLGSMEWEGTGYLAVSQANHFGLKTIISRYRTKDHVYMSLLDYVRKRGMWPSSQQRFCTSEFKRGPGGRVITAVTKGMTKSKVLYVFGFRAVESPSRAKKKELSLNKRYTTKTREVWDYHPIHKWSTKKVWTTILDNKLPYHQAYTLGMPRLSCVFCIFSPFDALVVAGKNNRKLLDEYIQVEDEIGHTFQKDFSLRQVRDAIEAGMEPGVVSDWKM